MIKFITITAASFLLSISGLTYSYDRYHRHHPHRHQHYYHHDRGIVHEAGHTAGNVVKDTGRGVGNILNRL